MEVWKQERDSRESFLYGELVLVVYRLERAVYGGQIVAC